MLRPVVIVVALLALLLGGCAQAAQKAVEQATGVQTSQKGDTVTVKGKEGETVVISSTLPEELKDFPVPQGFKLDSSGSMSAKGDKLSVATWKGKSTLQAVADFYAKTMPGQGWQEETTFTSDTGSLLNYSKGDSSVTITTSKEGDEISISVMLGKSSQKPATPTAKPAAADTSTSAKPTATSAKPEPAPKPEATPTPAPPKTTDASALPAELKDLPVPSGFSVVKDSVVRFAEGGKFKAAVAKWFGKTGVKEVGEFYKRALPAKGWTEEQFAGAEDDILATYKNENEGLVLILNIEKTEAGTEIITEVAKE